MKDALKSFLTAQTAEEISHADIPEFQIMIRSGQLPVSLRNLTSEHVNKLIKVYVIIVIYYNDKNNFHMKGPWNNY